MPDWNRREFLQLTGAGIGSVSIPDYQPTVRKLSTQKGPDRHLRDRVGVTHVDGNYHHTDEDYLNEGAKQIRGIGSRVIKVWFHYVASEGEQKYRYNSDWPDQFDNMVEIASHRYFRELFDRDFRTYVLVAYSMNDSGSFSHGKGGKHYFKHGVSDSQFQHEEAAFYDLTAHLLEEYQGTGKEFILQHWQGDWAILPFSVRDEIQANHIQEDDEEPTTTAVEGMIQWLNARQTGVERARQDIDSDVKVLHAAEVNMVRRAMRGQRRVINEVVPESTVDLVSHNSYREMWATYRRWNPDEAPQKFRETLDFVNQHAPGPNAYVKDALVDSSKNVLVGEYGLPITWVGDKSGTRIAKLATNVSLDWGATWTLYWQIYGNEHGKGFWLIRPDGTRTPVYDYFKRIIAENSVPPLPDHTEYVFKFNRAVLEHEVNDEVSKEDSRWLTFACSQLEFLNSQGRVIEKYDIGVPSDEPVMSRGVSWPGEYGGRTWRWFVGEGRWEPRTYIYVPTQVADRAAKIRLTGRPVGKADIELTIVVHGERTEAIDIPKNSGWRKYTRELPFAPASPSPISNTETASQAPPPVETPTQRSSGNSPANRGSSTDGGNQPISDVATTADNPGFEIPLTIAGIAGGLGLLKRFRGSSKED